MAKTHHIIQIKKDPTSTINSNESTGMLEQKDEKRVDEKSGEKKEDKGLKEQLCAKVPSSYLRRARRLK